MNIQLKISDMSCSACSETITKAVIAVDSTAIVTADLKTKQVNIETQASETAIKNAITVAGYQAS